MTDAASGGPQGSTFWEMVGPQYIAAPDWQQIDADERRPVASLATWWLRSVVHQAEPAADCWN